MANSQSPIITDLASISPEVEDGKAFFHGWPRFHILSTHLNADEVNELEEQVESAGGDLTYDITEAVILLTVVNSLRRARFELQTRKLKFEVIEQPDNVVIGKRKRQEMKAAGSERSEVAVYDLPNMPHGQFIVAKSEWLSQSVENKKLFDIQPFVILIAKHTSGVDSPPSKIPVRQATSAGNQPEPQHVKNSEQTHSSPIRERSPVISQKDQRAFRRSAGSNITRHLLRETTSEHDAASQNDLPEPPQWVKEHKTYACERRAPLNSPNDKFIGLLKKIRLARTLILDEIGVRAYSTSIASIAAYPYLLTDPKEILQLPGCEQKIAILFREYQSTGQIEESRAIEKDEALKVIESFYNIWGVGAKTARDFYDRGWRDTDDIIQYGWNSLTRVQQIGLKYYDEFEGKIPRSEVEFIASVVTYHAKRVVDEDISCTIVGGYRRGKPESGDADIIISHPRENGTLYLIKRLVSALEKAKWITHTLTLSETNSARNQEPLNLKPDPTKSGGFDTLDKALVVWQDPSWPNKEADLAKNPKAKNPNIHRRVDIIISPWRTVGCAIAGWTSGTTFQRDLRRYAKARKGWKFDSSGCRDRATGRWLDLEKYTNEVTRATTPLEAEKRVFEGFGLEWIDPELRCTG